MLWEKPSFRHFSIQYLLNRVNVQSKIQQTFLILRLRINIAVGCKASQMLDLAPFVIFFRICVFPRKFPRDVKPSCCQASPDILRYPQISIDIRRQFLSHCAHTSSVPPIGYIYITTCGIDNTLKYFITCLREN